MKINLNFVLFLSIMSAILPNNALCRELMAINDDYKTAIVNAIYKVEGGEKTKYPYGVMSIKTNGNKELARKICSNTVKNNYIRWQKAGSHGEFLDYLADVYCPPSADKQGNINWKKNIRKFLKKS